MAMEGSVSCRYEATATVYIWRPIRLEHGEKTYAEGYGMMIKTTKKQCHNYKTIRKRGDIRLNFYFYSKSKS